MMPRASATLKMKRGCLRGSQELSFPTEPRRELIAASWHEEPICHFEDDVSLSCV